MTNTPDELERVLIPIDIVRAAVDAALQTVKRARWEPEERQAAEAIAGALHNNLDDHDQLSVGVGQVVTWAAEHGDGYDDATRTPMLHDLSNRLDVIAAQLLPEKW